MGQVRQWIGVGVLPDAPGCPDVSVRNATYDERERGAKQGHKQAVFLRSHSGFYSSTPDSSYNSRDLISCA